MKSPKWVVTTRQLIKSNQGFGWSISGWERNNKLITKVVYRYPDGSRNSILIDLDWASDNSGKMINLIEELAEIMKERSVDLCKAYELINGNKISKNSKKINWEAIIDEFKNDERGNRRGTTKAGLKLRMERTLLALNTKPIPRNAEQLFKNYAQLFFNRTMPKGGVGRKRDMGDLRAFLNWVVLEKKYLPLEWLPLTSKQYGKYVGAVPKGKKKKRATQPIATEHIEMLCEALKRENKLGLRAIVILSAVYGIRISEIAKMEIIDGNLEITTLKQNVKTMLEEPHTRIVEPLNLPNLPNAGQEIIEDIASGKIQFPNPIKRGIEKSNDEDGYKLVGERFGKMLNRFWYWKELKKENPDYVPYGLRHSFAYRGSMEISPPIPYRVLADLMGHDLETHLQSYGKWSNNKENKKRMEEANKNILVNYSLVKTS